MPEQIVWRGTSSQWKNFGRYLLSAVLGIVVLVVFAMLRNSGSPRLSDASSYILLLLVVPILMVLGRYLETKSKIYELTTERLKTTKGVFGKVTDTLELYRVKDLETRQPFLYRLAGIENVQVNTSDVTSPFVLLEAIPCAVALGDKIRNQVEAIRAQKGVREIDVE
jgi:membrane protein YdbS with pleckstrin-like domain